jgi:nitrate reductase delta subunit
MAIEQNPGHLALADALRYPAPGRLDALTDSLRTLPEGAVKDGLAAFIRGVAPLTLGAWEELHTRTLDLDPPAAPYVGYQMWGDSYQRGAFMAKMNRALADARVDKDGELPDHLGACLRYLAVTPDPLPELVEVFGPAVERMTNALRKAQPDNPYLRLFEAARAAGPDPADQGVAPQGAKKEAA